ncbi:uncharacterized protein [Dermacentor albipictus]|uniref:uncharacterized protein isoform X4 n=1 Tax=Dermacentor albipictus TaxID=60249 RepID=UPI0038FC9A77
MERRRRRSSSKSSSSSRRTSRSSTGSEQSNRSRSKSRSNSTGEAPPAEPVQAAPADSATAPGPTTSEARRWAPWRSLSVTAAPPHRIDEAQPAHRPSTGEVKYTTREDARSSLGENKYPTGDMARSASLGDTRYQTGEMTRSASLAETRYQTGERARSASLGETRYQTGERARFASLGESRYLTSEMARTSSLGEAMYPTGETARSASLGEIKGPAKKSRSTRRVEVTFSVVEEERVGETSSWKPLILKIALVVGLLTVVLTAMFVLLMPSRPSGSAPEATTSPGPYPVCETADCEAHAKILLSTDPAAGNPCDDFGSFVCSAWEKQLLTVHSFTEQLLMASLMDLTRMKPAGSGGHATLEDRPAEFMALCATARPDRDSGGVEAFKEFLSREVNFLGGRAERTVTYAQLLEALVISSGKWLVPLWFQFDLIRTGAYPSFILIKPEPLVSFWRQLHGRLRLYKDYVEWFIAVVYDKGASSVPASYLEFLRNKSAAVQTDVLRWLSVADSEAHPVPLNGSLSDLSEFTPKFPGTAWAAAASKVGDWNIGEHHAVYVSSTGLLDAMNVASGALTARELLYHTVWWFVQQIGALTSNELFEATRVAFGKGNEAYQELLCGVQPRARQRRQVLQTRPDVADRLQSAARGDLGGHGRVPGPVLLRRGHRGHALRGPGVRVRPEALARHGRPVPAPRGRLRPVARGGLEGPAARGHAVRGQRREAEGVSFPAGDGPGLRGVPQGCERHPRASAEGLGGVHWAADLLHDCVLQPLRRGPSGTSPFAGLQCGCAKLRAVLGGLSLLPRFGHEPEGQMCPPDNVIAAPAVPMYGRWGTMAWHL